VDFTITTPELRFSVHTGVKNLEFGLVRAENLAEAVFLELSADPERRKT
jgi:hypothetical protein